MKKNIVLSLLISFISISLSAQSFHKSQTLRSDEEDSESVEETDPPQSAKNMKHSWEMGLNISYIISSIIPQFPPGNYGLSENQFMLRKYFDRKNVLYIGAIFETNNDDFTNYDTLNGQSNQSKYSISLGYERYSDLGKRWRFYWGGDMGYAASSYVYEYFQEGGNFLKKSETKNSALIFKPKAGIVLDISKRISLSTQLSVNMSWDDKETNYSYFPNPRYKDYSNYSSGFNTNFIYPAEVILRMRL